MRRASCLIVELEHMEQKFAMAADGASDFQLKTPFAVTGACCPSATVHSESNEWSA